MHEKGGENGAGQGLALMVKEEIRCSREVKRGENS